MTTKYELHLAVEVQVSNLQKNITEGLMAVIQLKDTTEGIKEFATNSEYEPVVVFTDGTTIKLTWEEIAKIALSNKRMIDLKNKNWSR